MKQNGKTVLNERLVIEFLIFAACCYQENPIGYEKNHYVNYSSSICLGSPRLHK